MDVARDVLCELPINVVLVDDHDAVRRNLRRLLESEHDMQVAFPDSGDPLPAMRHLAGHVPDVLLLDLRTPNGSSIEWIRRLRRQAPDTEIVVLTREDCPAFANRAIDAGAIGYVLEDNARSELPFAVRCAARGHEYVSPPVAARRDGLRMALNGDGLSSRETEVLRLIALGFTSIQIADRLHLSRRTIETHRTRIHRKLGLAQRSELVRYALTRHLIGPGPEAARVGERDDG